MKTLRSSKARSAEKNSSTKKARRPATLPPLPLKMSRILVPVDFSEHSQAALRYALAFAAKFDAAVTLVHIVEQTVYPGDWMYPPLATSDFAVEKREQLLGKLQELTAGADVSAKHIVRIGRAWQEVIEIAKDEKCDLIIIATHGYTGLKHVLLGSVAEKIVRHAPCPVLSVRPEEE
jgi:universal stress protein A